MTHDRFIADALMTLIRQGEMTRQLLPAIGSSEDQWGGSPSPNSHGLRTRDDPYPRPLSHWQRARLRL
jgi:hypothetical protein